MTNNTSTGHKFKFKLLLLISIILAIFSRIYYAAIDEYLANSHRKISIPHLFKQLLPTNDTVVGGLSLQVARDNLTILERFDKKWALRPPLPLFNAKDNNCGMVLAGNPVSGRTGDQMGYTANLFAFAWENKMVPYFPKKRKFLTNAKFVHAFANMERLIPIYNGSENFKTTKANKKLTCGQNLKLGSPGFALIRKHIQVIRRLFQFKNKTLNMCRRAISKVVVDQVGLANESCVLVAGHARRGDFVWSIYHLSNFHSKPASGDFLRRAYNLLNEQFMREGRCAVFIFVTDDVKWTLRNVPSQPNVAVLSPSNKVNKTSGTFGLWGALLSGGTVIRQANSYLNVDLPGWISLPACSGRNLTDVQLNNLGNAECWPGNTFTTGPKWCREKKICFYTRGHPPIGYKPKS